MGFKTVVRPHVASLLLNAKIFESGFHILNYFELNDLQRNLVVFLEQFMYLYIYSSNKKLLCCASARYNIKQTETVIKRNFIIIN